MRRGRLLILLGIILGLATAVIVLVVLTRGGPEVIPPPTGVGAEVTPTPIPTQQVWVALQPIPRGGEFVEGTLGLRDWPSTNVPPDVIGDRAETIGRVATVDIVQGMPILRGYLAERGAAGQAALQVPEGRVAVAFPITEQSSVAYAIQPGDFVDVLIVASFIDFDQEFQTKLPNLISFLSKQEDEAGNVTFQFTTPTDEGRFEAPPGLPPEIPGAYVYPREPQRPRRVAQLTVPAAKVLRVGPWIDLPSAQPTPTPEEGQPPPPPPPPDIVTLAVEPQDALVLLWARQSEMYMELALRAPETEGARYNPEAVTLQYMLTRFDIAVPPELEYGFAREAFITSSGTTTSETPPTEDVGQ
jgi:Flp pilus assembly protein CpaB